MEPERFSAVAMCSLQLLWKADLLKTKASRGWAWGNASLCFLLSCPLPVNAQDFLSLGSYCAPSALLFLWLSLGLRASAVPLASVSISPGRLTCPPLIALISANLAKAMWFWENWLLRCTSFLDSPWIYVEVMAQCQLQTGTGRGAS